MTFEPEYKVTIQGTTFLLTKSMIGFDSPNYFTACFTGDYSESHSGSVELYRDPDIFRIVISYLCGYSVLPLNDKTIPKNMTSTRALRYLRADALFYQLDGLARACEVHLKRKGIDDSPRKYLVLGGSNPLSLTEEETNPGNYIHHDDNINILTEPTSEAELMSSLPTTCDWQLSVDADTLGQEPLNKINTPEMLNSLDDMYVASAMGRFVAESVQNYNPKRYRIVGWHVELVQREYPFIEAFVVCEDLETEVD
ncbi:hypothetical protein FRC11_013065 [Ceratobasidium sp. 423]|nr:hypothetical protein FRC11_013065 [Ceratobasidium sp. 423]